MKIKQYIYNFFSKGHERSIKAKKNIVASFGLKGLSMLIGLILVPLILGYLDAERYGIWLTLSSIVTWFSFFDIGLGNGLRNRLAESIAKNDMSLARTYISTTYAIIGVISIITIFVFLLINNFINWQKVLNTTTISNNELALLAIIILVFFILRLFFQLIGIILLSDQRPAINNAFGPMANILSLILIFICTKTSDSSLVILSLILSASPVFVFFIMSIILFNKSYRHLIPSFKYIEFAKSKDLLNLGFKFFFFQVSAIIFFSTTNFFIAQFSNQETVASYNVAYKYLYTINMIYAIILSPFWSAVTDAYARNDFIWLKNSLKKLNLISALMIIFLILALSISTIVYKIWIGNKLLVPFNLSLVITMYLAQQIFIAPFSTFINGLGKLKLGIIVLTLKLILFFPIVYLLGKTFGAPGVVLSMFFIQLPSIIIEPIQVIKLINKNAKGIWNK